ncbi:helix-turn-helix domain-containing protein [Cellvibrio japonicus]|uniref:Aldehyde dehydrogenase n=1 Tax=Cellvibrio japonicus (strain Ueda107) TaxID=498211 RepID=B3PEW6_CELJU|nr:helix-turn-helix domain-containing protein [Cellvibrio japonicus]ACE83785.1 aldehyde dehydrogenase [Cellvibrio japonicus Ueda107]
MNEANDTVIPPSLDSHMDLGRKLKAIREAHNLSQRELAKRAGITNSSISMIEQGQVSPSVQSLERILTAFPLSLAEFFSPGGILPAPVLITRQLLELQQDNQVYGATIQHLVNGIDKPELDMQRIFLPPGTRSALAYARVGDVSAVLLDGYITLYCGEVIMSLQPGDGVYLRRGHFYRFGNTHTDTAQLVLCTLVDQFGAK